MVQWGHTDSDLSLSAPAEERGILRSPSPTMSSQLSRRAFLGFGAVAAAAAFVPARALAAAAPAAARPSLAMARDLSFFHTPTGEHLSTAYCAGVEYVSPA